MATNRKKFVLETPTSTTGENLMTKNRIAKKSASKAVSALKSRSKSKQPTKQSASPSKSKTAKPAATNKVREIWYRIEVSSYWNPPKCRRGKWRNHFYNFKTKEADCDCRYWPDGFHYRFPDLMPEIYTNDLAKAEKVFDEICSRGDDWPPFEYFKGSDEHVAYCAIVTHDECLIKKVTSDVLNWTERNWH